jgi:hypothetical protein
MLILCHCCILTQARMHTFTLTFTLPRDHAIKCTQIYKHTHTQSLPCKHAHSCSHTHFYPYTVTLCTHAHSHTHPSSLPLAITLSISLSNLYTHILPHTHIFRHDLPIVTHTLPQSMAWLALTSQQVRQHQGTGATADSYLNPCPPQLVRKECKGVALDLTLDLSQYI